MSGAVVKKRARGGYLALSGANRLFRIGATGSSHDEALAALAEAEAAWIVNLASGPSRRLRLPDEAVESGVGLDGA
jgi:hypothetical protein